MPRLRTTRANVIARRTVWAVLGVGLCAVLYWAFVSRPGRPGLRARDIVNAADMATGAIAPGEIIFLFPTHAGPATLAGSQQGNGARMPSVLGDTRVLFDGVPAPLLWAVRGEIAAVVPYEMRAGRTTRVVVKYRGRRSIPVSMQVTNSVPAVFTRDRSGKGEASMLNQTGCCNSGSNPAPRGSIGGLYATGGGQTSPPGIDGYVVPTLKNVADYATPQEKVRVTLGGKPAEVLYAGAAPHFVAGLLAVNFRIPMDAPIGGAVPLVLTVGNASSPIQVTMAVRSERQRVLVIDSDAVVLDWYKRVLSREGYDVRVARNDDDALARMAGQPVDAVISDVPADGPPQTRIETLRRIQGAGPQLRIATTLPAHLQNGLKNADLLGAQMIFTRPLNPEQVTARVLQLLMPMPVDYDTPPPIADFLRTRLSGKLSSIGQRGSLNIDLAGAIAESGLIHAQFVEDRQQHVGKRCTVRARTMQIAA
jgi:uncharacterized protein (TIGR03437 family)